MASIIKNARVKGGTWARCAASWKSDPNGKGPYYGIVHDESPNSAPELYRTIEDAEKMLLWLRRNSTERGLIFVYDKGDERK